MADEVKDKKSVKMEVKNEPKSENPGGAELLKKAKAGELGSMEEADKPGLVISSNDHPVHVKYGDHTIRMSPRARQKVRDWTKLSSQLPQGIVLKKLDEK